VAEKNIFAVIMAGGSGTRFWPASREHLPKQFLKITGDRTMLEETIARVEPLTHLANIYPVVGQVHAQITGELLSGMPVKTLIEPVGRNTAACIGLAALHIKQFSEDDPIAVLPADHFIGDLQSFTQTINAGADLARSGAIIMVGIIPGRPETGYGYIKTAAEIGRSLNHIYFSVERFVEKPDYKTALDYLANGNYLWNSGIFIFTAKTILSQIEECMPALYQGLREIEKSIGTADYDQVLNRVYAQLPSVSIDYGVMEKTEKPIYVFRGDFGWSDVGSWQALHELRSSEYDEHGNLLLGNALVVDSKNNLVYSVTERAVALLGVEGLVVVDTPDALMVTEISRSQDVKILQEIFKKTGRRESTK
jgi:mannose-1-phosphate guanylyltransferase